MTNRKLSYFILAAFLGLFSACRQGNIKKGPELPSLRETYSRYDDAPFGSSMSYRLFKNAYSDFYVRERKEPFQKFWLENTTDNSLYFSLSKRLFATEQDVEYMLRFASNGNDLFLVSRDFDSSLLKAAGVSEVDAGDILASSLSLFFVEAMNDSKVSLSPKYYGDTTLHEYFYLPFTRHFTLDSGSKAKVLSHNDFGAPNCIVFFHGRGRIFLHCDPRAFSNYYLLKENNARILTSLLGYTKSNPSYVYWDDFYARQNYRRDEGNNTGLGFILSKPPLAWAFWLSLLLLLLYILFGGKRRQRIVEERKPNINYSVNFAETVGLLYLQHKNNRSIADKMILYFNDFVRNNYFLNTNHIDEEFISTLSRKSGVSTDQVSKLYGTIKTAQNNFDVDDYRLLTLNNQIQNFYKKLK